MQTNVRRPESCLKKKSVNVTQLPVVIYTVLSACQLYLLYLLYFQQHTFYQIFAFLDIVSVMSFLLLCVTRAFYDIHCLTLQA